MSTPVFMVVNNDVWRDGRVIRLANFLVGEGMPVTVIGVKSNLVPSDFESENDFSPVFLESLSLESICEELKYAQDLILWTHDFQTLELGQKIIRHLSKGSGAAYWVHDVHEWLPGLEGILGNDILKKLLKQEVEILPQADDVITVNDSIAQYLEQVCDFAKPTVVSNTPLASPELKTNNLREALKLPADSKIMVYTGSVKASANLELVFDAMSLMSESVHLAIVGSLNPLESIYSNSFSFQLVKHRVHDLGRVQPGTVVDVIRGADLGVLARRRNGNVDAAIPTKVAEYVNAELPVLSVNAVSMVRLMKQTEIGRTFRDGDYEDFARQATSLLGESRANSTLPDILNPESTAKSLKAVIERAENFFSLLDSGNRVLLGPSASAGQSRALKASLNAAGYSAKVVTKWMHPFRYGSDQTFRTEYWNPEELYSHLAKRFDIFFFHSSTFYSKISDTRDLSDVLNEELLFLKSMGKKVFFAFRGSEVRNPYIWREHNPGQPVEFFEAVKGLSKPSQFVSNFVNIASLRADEIFVPDEEVQAYVPHATVLPRLVFDPVDNKNRTKREADTGKVRILHAPSRQSIKGTSEVVKAVESMKTKGMDVELNLVHGESHSAVLEAMAESDIYIDQLVLGSYGVASLEALAAGSLPVARISKGAFTNPDLAPVFNADTTSLEDELTKLVLDKSFRDSELKRCAEISQARHSSQFIVEIFQSHMSKTEDTLAHQSSGLIGSKFTHPMWQSKSSTSSEIRQIDKGGQLETENNNQATSKFAESLEQPEYGKESPPSKAQSRYRFRPLRLLADAVNQHLRSSQRIAHELRLIRIAIQRKSK